MTQRRAIGIVRVSRSNGRAGESFSSPRDQIDHMAALAHKNGWHITFPQPYEIDVSGDALLTSRPQLSRAVLAVQTGEADIIVGAFTERLWWNHETASQVIRLVEDANGEVWSADQGLLTRRSAADEFSGTVRTAADRLSRRQNAEKSAAAIQRAINRGVPPWPRVTAGYRKREDGRYEPDPATAQVVQGAFEHRARGVTVREARDHLQAGGVRLTYPAVVKLLQSRVVLGEIHFGDFTPNPAAHEPIIDRATWEAVQRVRVPAGRNTKSPRLLARLGVLRCGTCESRMVTNVVVGNKGRTEYEIYRCQNTDCARRVTVSAPNAETAVVERVLDAHGDAEGRAAVETSLQAAQARLDRAQSELDAAINAFSVLGNEPAAVARLTELQEERDAALRERDELRGHARALRINLRDAWPRMTLEERRDAIRSTVRVAVVHPGRGPDRVVVELFGQQPVRDAV